LRIYLVDDDAALRRALREVLERAGHEVRDDANGLATRRTLGDWLPDLVICDMLMPDAEGFEVLRTVRGGNSRAKFVMISGASGELSGFLDRAPLLGADAVLKKPFTPPDLLKLIDSLFPATSGAEEHEPCMR
jgi:two-component system chemotaxis response regulator CheY